MAAFLAAAGSAAAQYPEIALHNRTTETLKICFYNGTDPVMWFPVKCHTIESGKTVSIVHGEVEYGIRAYVPGFIDQHLYAYSKLRNIYGRISFGATQGEFTERSTPQPTPIHYILKVCNKTSPDPVYFVLAFDDGKTLYSRGWWFVEKDGCQDFPVSRMLYEEWSVPYGTFPRTHYYARTYGASAKVWEGGPGDLQNCIEITKQFNRSGPLGSIADGYVKCPDNNLTRTVRMRRLPDPKAVEQYYYLTF